MEKIDNLSGAISPALRQSEPAVGEKKMHAPPSCQLASALEESGDRLESCLERINDILCRVDL